MQKKLFSYIDNAETLAVELETELCKYPAIAPESGGQGELDKTLWLEGWLTKRGFPFRRIDIKDEKAKEGIRPNLVVDVNAACNSGAASHGPADGALWIMSHTDVVPPGEMSLWESDPWSVIRRDDPPGPRLIGRGVEDNQQGLVSSLIAAVAFMETGLAPGLPVKLLLCADEECGSAYGVAALLREHSDLFGKSDLILIPDGGDSNGETIEIAEKNLLWLEFTTLGKQAHGSRPDLGANAHLAGAELAIRLHSELGTMFNDRDPLFEPDYSTFQPTKKTSNVPNINTIPGEDRFCMDMRILPRYPVDTILSAIDRLKAEIEKKHKVTINYIVHQRVESQATPADSPLVTMLSGAVETVYGVKTRPIGIGGGTVGAFFRNRGIHCAVWSRMDNTAHQPNEYALISNILGDAKVMALLMAGRE
ncbi:MAG: M20 family metallo-hydrolase [Spirochaetaceae bacterium]|jgi:succinyl-diaminopimelate desuccinylase|nr:M20 family metallo-hydrolase [Spirochaetaceae bacterium]